MKKFWFFFVSIFLGFVSENSIRAYNFKLGIIGADDRVLLTKDGPPWDAIGQVNISSHRRISRCTGTLIAEDRVLTAAHCLIDENTKKHWPLNTIHFVAGVRGELNKGHATAKCLKFMKDVKFWTGRVKNRFNLKDFINDAAVIILSKSLEVQPASLAESFVETQGLTFLHVAYPAERRFLPSAHINCHLIEFETNSILWSTDCDSSPASSGGPLFQMGQHKPLLAAIMVGAGEYNYALPFAAWKHLISDGLCP